MRIALRRRFDHAPAALFALTTSLGCGARIEAPVDTARSYWPAEARRATVPSDVTRLRLTTERADDIGTLHDHSGTFLCALPCTALVPLHSGWSVQIGTHSGKLRTVDVPDAFDDVPLGGTATAVVQPKRGHPGAALTLVISGALLAGIGAIAFVASAQNRGKGDSAGDAFGPFGAGMMAIGVPMMIGGSLWSGFVQAPSFDIR